MRGVKIAITFMTLAIFICLGLLIYGMTNPNMFKKDIEATENVTLSMMQEQSKTSSIAASVPMMIDHGVSYPASITLPEGHRVLQMTADNGKLYFLLEDSAQKNSLYIWSEDGTIAQHIQMNY